MPKDRVASVRTPLQDILDGARCPVCAGPLGGRQTVCSPRCRAARHRDRLADARRERDGEVRRLLEAALRLLDK